MEPANGQGCLKWRLIEPVIEISLINYIFLTIFFFLFAIFVVLLPPKSAMDCCLTKEKRRSLSTMVREHNVYCLTIYFITLIINNSILKRLMKKQFLLGLVAMALPLTMWAADDKTVSVKAIDVTYDGDATKSGITVTVGNTPLTENTDYFVVYTRNEAKVQTVRDAGEYTGTITLVGKYYDYSLPTDAPKDGYTFTVNKLKVTGGVNLNGDVEVEYTGAEIAGTEAITVEGQYKGKSVLDALVATDLSAAVLETDDAAKERANFLAGLQVVGFKEAPIGPDVKTGGYGVQVINKLTKDTDEHYWDSNYEYEPASSGNYVALTIVPKNLTATIANTKYAGKVINVTEWKKEDCTEWKKDESKYEGAIDKDAAGLEFEFTASGEVKNAKNYKDIITAKVKDNPNYVISEVNYEITKAELAITQIAGKNLGITYPTAVPLDLNSYFEYKSLLGDDSKSSLPQNAVADSIQVKTLLGLTMNFDRTKTATYGDTGYDVYPYVKVNPAAPAVPAVEKVTDTKTGAISYKDLGLLDNYTIKYEVVPFYAWKKQIRNDDNSFEFTWNKDVDMTYQGHDFEIPEGIVEVKYNATGEILKEGTDYVVKQARMTDVLARNAGEAFRIKIEALPSSEHFKSKVEFSGEPYFTIVKAPLTIKVAEKDSLVKVFDGNGSGDLSKYYTFDELLDEDADENGLPAEGWLTLETRQVGKKDQDTDYLVHLWTAKGRVENFTSKEPGQGLTNYYVTYPEYETVKYMILSSDFVLYGDNYETLKKANEVAGITTDIVTNTVKLEKYAGLTVPEVTIENVRGLNTQLFRGGRYYSLVLPFDIKVRELSDQLGYAIVNIPDVRNTEKENLKFGLTITEVPANTMMIFRVDGFGDENGEDLEDITLTFKNKTIATDLESNEDFASDNAGHHFMITYEAKELTEANQYYWKPVPGNDGSVYSSATQYMKDYGKALVVNAFNGYFEFDANSEARSIELEGADGSVTAINLVTGETTNYGAEGWYTVGGVKLNAQPTQKGIYINNGKKVVIK